MTEDERLNGSFCRVDFEPAYASFRVQDLTVKVGEFNGVVVDDADVTLRGREKARGGGGGGGELRTGQRLQRRRKKSLTDSCSGEILDDRTA